MAATNGYSRLTGTMSFRRRHICSRATGHFRTSLHIREDSAPRVYSAKQVALSPERRGPPRAEGDRVRCDALLALALNRQSVIPALTINSLQTL